MRSYWQPSQVSSSYAVCGPLWPDTAPLGDAGAQQRPPPRKVRFSQRYVGHVPVVEEHLVAPGAGAGGPPAAGAAAAAEAGAAAGAAEGRQRMRAHEQAHADAVTHLLGVEVSPGSRLLLSCSRDGAIKAWR